MNDPTVSLLICDDHKVLTDALSMVVGLDPSLSLVAAPVHTPEEGVALAQEQLPDVVLMDIRMPEMDGLEATRRLAADSRTAECRVLILTTFDLDEYIYEALRAGASGFVLKDDPPEQLIAAIRTVAAGDALLSPAVTTREAVPVPPLKPSR